MSKTVLFQMYLIEKPEASLLGDGTYVSDPKIDPKILVGPVQMFAVSTAVAMTKVMQAYAAEVVDVDPNRLSVVGCPISEILY